MPSSSPAVAGRRTNAKSIATRLRVERVSTPNGVAIQESEWGTGERRSAHLMGGGVGAKRGREKTDPLRFINCRINPFTEFELVEPVTEKWGNRRIPVRHCFAVVPRTSAVDFPSKPPILQAMDALISTGHKPNMQSTEMRTIRESK